MNRKDVMNKNSIQVTSEIIRAFDLGMSYRETSPSQGGRCRIGDEVGRHAVEVVLLGFEIVVETKAIAYCS